jgi:sulfatase modifying factor 1
MSLPAPKNMVWVSGGEFLMGSGEFYPEERPGHRVSVEGADSHPWLLGA